MERITSKGEMIMMLLVLKNIAEGLICLGFMSFVGYYLGWERGRYEGYSKAHSEINNKRSKTHMSDIRADD